MKWYMGLSSAVLIALSMNHFVWAASHFGVNFYDEADFVGTQYQFTSQAMSALPRIADQRFTFLRTITDFNEGDPSQKICACYQVNGQMVDTRQCAFEQGMVAHPDLQTVFTIENPAKWLYNLDSAVAYVYQFIVPLAGQVVYPTDPQLQPDFWGTKPTNMRAAGCVLATKAHNQIVAIVVGLEVGAHLNPIASNFTHRVQQVNNLPTYIENLTQALTRLGLKQRIYVTTSLAPSNCDLATGQCQGIYEALQLDNGQYVLNNTQQQVNINGKQKTINFTRVISALKQIAQQNYTGTAPGVLVSLYHYWRYDPDRHYDQLDAAQWVQQIDQYYHDVQAAFALQNGKVLLPVSIGEIGWPAAGSNQCDLSPNKPSSQIQIRLLQGIQQWGEHDVQAPYIFIWRLFDVDPAVADLYACGEQNPEGHYGLYPGSLNHYINEDNPQPRNADAFPNFKS